MQDISYNICPKCGEVGAHAEECCTEKQTTPVEINCYLTDTQKQALENLLSIWNKEKEGWCVIKVHLYVRNEAIIYLIITDKTIEEVKSIGNIDKYAEEEIRSRINQWLQTREGWEKAREEFYGHAVSWNQIEECPLEEMMMTTNFALTYGIHNMLDGVQIDVLSDDKIPYDNVPATLKILKTDGTTETQNVIVNLADNLINLDKRLDDETIEDISVVFENGEELDCYICPSNELHLK